jgi:hypothetical protein
MRWPAAYRRSVRWSIGASQRRTRVIFSVCVPESYCTTPMATAERCGFASICRAGKDTYASTRAREGLDRRVTG